MKLRKVSALLALAVAAALAAGCSSASECGDKAGGCPAAEGPVVLRMASGTSQLSQASGVADFIRRLHKLSGGEIQVKVINQWGDYAADNEVQVVHAVAAGAVDLGWAGSDVFDTIGDPGFRALSAPMLIDSYPLEKAVLKTEIPALMLAGLSRVHVTGLAALGDGLRLPIAVRRALLGPKDWRGLSIGTYRSGVQEQAIRALGATPVVAFGLYRVHDLASGAIQGFELDMWRYVHNVPVPHARYVTANVVLWPYFDVLFANPARLASLTAQQRAWIQQAAQQAAVSSVSLIAHYNRAEVHQACAEGARLATASEADLAALRAAFAPFYQSLEADRQTRAFIRQIQQLKKVTPPGPAAAIPASCAAGR
jgi:TRAP-type C4-dicarboxylate transport system substrate-binding protein